MFKKAFYDRMPDENKVELLDCLDGKDREAFEQYLTSCADDKNWELLLSWADNFGCTHYTFRHKKSYKKVCVAKRDDEGGLPSALDDLRFVDADVRRR